MAASILDLIKNQVAAQAGNVEIPAQAKNTVLNGLTDSIFGSLTQTVAKPGGVDLIKNLLTGKTAAASSPITALAGNMFNANILKKLNLGSLLNGKLAALVPAVIFLHEVLFALRFGHHHLNVESCALDYGVIVFEYLSITADKLSALGVELFIF